MSLLICNCVYDYNSTIKNGIIKDIKAMLKTLSPKIGKM